MAVSTREIVLNVGTQDSIIADHDDYHKLAFIERGKCHQSMKEHEKVRARFLGSNLHSSFLTSRTWDLFFFNG